MKMPGLRERPTRRSWRPSKDELWTVRESITVASGLRVNLNRLSDDEVGELSRLVREIQADGERGVLRTDPAALNDVGKLRRWEMLVAKAAEKPADFFDQQREQAATAEAVAARKLKPSAHPKLMEAG